MPLRPSIAKEEILNACASWVLFCFAQMKGRWRKEPTCRFNSFAILLTSVLFHRSCCIFLSLIVAFSIERTLYRDFDCSFALFYEQRFHRGMFCFCRLVPLCFVVGDSLVIDKYEYVVAQRKSIVL